MNFANLSLEIGPFHDFVTFFHLDVSSNLKLDIFRHNGQPLEFLFRGGAWGVPLATTLLVLFPRGYRYCTSRQARTISVSQGEIRAGIVLLSLEYRYYHLKALTAAVINVVSIGGNIRCGARCPCVVQ